MWLRQFFLGALSEFSALSPGIIMQILLTDLHTIHKCCLEELGLSLLLVLILAPRGFSPATSVFSSPQKPTFLNSNSIWAQWTKSHLVDVPPLIFIFIFCDHYLNSYNLYVLQCIDMLGRTLLGLKGSIRISAT